jgi:hypothetical protein
MMSYDWTGVRTRRMKMMRYGIAVVVTVCLVLGAASLTLQAV